MCLYRYAGTCTAANDTSVPCLRSLPEGRNARHETAAASTWSTVRVRPRTLRAGWAYRFTAHLRKGAEREEVNATVVVLATRYNVRGRAQKGHRGILTY